MGWTTLPHPARSPDQAPSIYHMFGPVKDALCGRHLADDNELKVFMMCFKIKAGYFPTLVFLLNVGKSMLKMTKTLWKNSLIIAKDKRIIHVNFTVITITFSEEKNGSITFVPALITA
jgi:hypothetical protein